MAVPVRPERAGTEYALISNDLAERATGPRGGEDGPMLRSLNDLLGYTATATDGDIGKVRNFLLDDESWTVRYLVVEPGTFLDGRQVLISPVSVRDAAWKGHRFHLDLTREKVWNSPSVEADKPVSRQHEGDFSRYYGFPHYWRKAGHWDHASPTDPLSVGGSGGAPRRTTPQSGPSGDVHLRSAVDVRKYHVQGTDGAIGHVTDFLVDDERWEIRYLAIDTRDWWPGRKVLVPPLWATRISWEESRVYLKLSRDEVRKSPEWRPGAAVDREYEARLHDHYGRLGYWAGSDQPAEPETARRPGER